MDPTWWVVIGAVSAAIGGLGVTLGIDWLSQRLHRD